MCTFSLFLYVFLFMRLRTHIEFFPLPCICLCVLCFFWVGMVLLKMGRVTFSPCSASSESVITHHHMKSLFPFNLNSAMHIRDQDLTVKRHLEQTPSNLTGSELHALPLGAATPYATSSAQTRQSAQAKGPAHIMPRGAGTV